MLRKSVRLQDIRRLLKQAHALELSLQAVQRLKWYAYYCEHDSNISLTCRHFGIARSTFVRWSERFDPRDPRTLEEQSRRPHRVRLPETDTKIVEQIRALRLAFPRMGKVGVQHMLEEKFNMHLSTSTVGRIIARHHLFFADSDSHSAKRHAVETYAPEENESVSAPTIKIHSDPQEGGASSLVPFPSPQS
jgi:hypothetical protein